jgi:transposase
MDQETQSIERVIGFDCHPDSFTAAIVRGPTPAAALVEKIYNKVPLAQLPRWAQKHTTSQDLFVLEASGNSFDVVRSLEAIQRRARVVESCQMGKLKEAHANNDKLSAVRIGKAYLAGTTKQVWVPDAKTQGWRDWLHAYRKATKHSTQARNSLLSYLSDNGVRLQSGTDLTGGPKAEETLRAARAWTPRQWQVIEVLRLQLRHAEEQRDSWHRLIAQEVLTEPELVSIVRLCGVREITAFALGAFIGDIKRFANPKKLVKYVGLNPAFDDSGEEEWHGGIGGHGNKYLRCLLIEGAQAILRCSKTPLARWGRKLLARKGQINLVVAAIARKLVVAVWHLMMGRWTPVVEIEAPLEIKINKIIGQVGAEHLAQSGKTRKQWRQEIYQRLKTGKVYHLDPNRKWPPPAAPQPDGCAVAATV